METIQNKLKEINNKNKIILKSKEILDDILYLDGFELPRLGYHHNRYISTNNYKCASIKKQTFDGCFYNIASKDFPITKHNLEIFDKMSLLSSKINDLNNELMLFVKQLHSY